MYHPGINEFRCESRPKELTHTKRKSFSFGSMPNTIGGTDRPCIFRHLVKGVCEHCPVHRKWWPSNYQLCFALAWPCTWWPVFGRKEVSTKSSNRLLQMESSSATAVTAIYPGWCPLLLLQLWLPAKVQKWLHTGHNWVPQWSTEAYMFCPNCLCWASQQHHLCLHCASKHCTYRESATEWQAQWWSSGLSPMPTPHQPHGGGARTGLILLKTHNVSWKTRQTNTLNNYMYSAFQQEFTEIVSLWTF